MEKENPNEIANKILNQYFEGKSFGFVKETCESILSSFNEKILIKDDINNHKTTLDSLSKLHQLYQETLGCHTTKV
ncbi:hypothetical protein HUE46_01540 [Flavobacterium columnare]|uniref:hypothetical protein n=1 Tax=Flavobacterium columnare TaxID=996 RepID=UPI00177AD0BA|nr:hypothetical protein [Flavobacterium columnare]MBF6659367.1 hypothetical protein [Flavobacterium columnare]QOG88807.1 hypothetical protein HUE41_01540 [Flavobacterium columnare]QOG91466.1 hypothetical protein HUE42_01535 [Flavobacterium columnare]QOG94129.1 hypothetical protein HUE43_01540 [Flavobacterium columnare]QOG96788.1 hypothetical protein HUE44_01535 [Flavobacterium columnare]